MSPRGKPVKLHPEARTDLQQSVLFYAERDSRAKDTFKQRLAEAFAAIAQVPDRFPPMSGFKGVRRCRLRQFPFSILFIDQPDEVWVVAIAHGSRQPGFWKRRMR